MALNLSKDYTFTASTRALSSEVNANFDEIYSAFSGLEATTSTLAKLKMDADPATALEVATKQYVDAYANYKRPVLRYVNATSIDVEVNTATSDTTKIVFPDGNYRSVTEVTSSAHKYRRFIITATAEFTTGTEDSGMRSGETEANNTWYAIYAVKSLINSTKFVLVGTTVLPLEANIPTLDANFNANGWVYLGLIRNGDNAGTAGDVLYFWQAGNQTTFYHAVTASANVLYSCGILGATSAGATSLTWTPAEGTGAAQIPHNVKIVSYTVMSGSTGAAFNVTNDDETVWFYRLTNTPGTPVAPIPCKPKNRGIKIATTNSTAHDIYLYHFIDDALGAGSNPII